MTPQEWTVIAGWIDEWWPGKFEQTAEDAWYVALEGFDAEAVTTGLRSLLARGGAFRPSVAEVVAQIRKDPGAPTFSEMLALVFGPGGVLSARTSDRRSSWGPGERERADEAAMLERAATMHPRVGAFIQREGLRRLRALNLDDQDVGGIRRHELEERWTQFLEATEDRDVAALAAPRRGGGLARLDPLAALGRNRPPELVSGDVNDDKSTLEGSNV